jgi:predicted PurR-regulated permease PerM
MNPDLTSERLQKAAHWVIIITVSIVGLIYFKALLEPIVLALVLWYLIRTARKYVGRIKINGKSLPLLVQRLIAFMLTFGVLWGIYGVISVNVGLISVNADKYDQNLKELLSNARQEPFIDELIPEIEEAIQKIDYRNLVTGVFNSVSTLLGNFTLIIIYVVFFVIEENFFSQKMDAIFSRKRKRQSFVHIISHISAAVNKYFTVKTEMSLLTAVLSYVVMLLLGVDFPVLWAFIIFILNYIPYIGSLAASLLPALFAIFQFGSFWPFVYVLAAVEAIQILVGNYVEPKVMGKSLNLSPLVVIIALSFWGAIWGILGMILSVPIVSVLVIICAQFDSTRTVAILLSENGNIETAIRPEDDEV